jgi:hypothetical protein
VRLTEARLQKARHKGPRVSLARYTAILDMQRAAAHMAEAQAVMLAAAGGEWEGRGCVALGGAAGMVGGSGRRPGWRRRRQ